jgi:hypothetical protein
MLSVVDDMPIDNETSMVTSSISKFLPVQLGSSEVLRALGVRVRSCI